MDRISARHREYLRCASPAQHQHPTWAHVWSSGGSASIRKASSANNPLETELIGIDWPCSWCSRSSKKNRRDCHGPPLNKGFQAAKAQMLFPIEILPFVVSGTGPWQTPLESDNSECLQVEDGTFHTTKLQNQRDKRGEHAFSTILCLALTSKSLLIHLATSPTLPFGQLGLRWLPAQNHTVTMYPWAVSNPKQDLQCSQKSNWIEDGAFAILPEHYQSVLQNPCQKEQCEKTYLWMHFGNPIALGFKQHAPTTQKACT